MNRKLLGRLVGAMSAMLAAAFLWVLFSGVFVAGSSVAHNNDFSNILPGQTVMRRVNRQRVWVTLISDTQRRKLAQFNEGAVVRGQGCDLTAAVCVISAATARAGIELRFVSEVPTSLAENLPWVGGFVNPNTGAVYDLIGRAYAFQAEARPLSVVDAP